MAATDSGLGLNWGTTAALAPFLHFMMQDTVLPTIADARNNNATVLSIMPQNTKFVGGRHIVERVRFGRNPKQFNAVGEDGRFPDPGNRKMRIYAYRSRQQFSRFIIQGKLMRAIQNGAASVDPVMDEIENFMPDYLLDKCRQMYSDGSGRLAEIAEAGAAATSQTFTCRVNQDIATGLSSPGATTAGCPDQEPTFYLEEGMRVLIITPSTTGATNGGTAKCVATVTSKDNSTEVTLAFVTAVVSGTTFADCNTVGVAIGDWIVKTSTGTADSSTFLTNARAIADSAFQAEPMGIPGIIGYTGPLDGTGPAGEVGADLTASPESVAPFNAYQWSGSDRPGVYASAGGRYFQGLPADSGGIGWTSDMSFNQGVVLHNNGTTRTVTDDIMMRSLSTLASRNSAKVNLWLSNYQARDNYAATLLGEKRFNDTLNLKGGWEIPLVGPGGIPWVVDRLCWRNSIFGLSLEDGGFQQYLVEALSWASEQGSNIWAFLQDHDKYQARMVEDYTVGVQVRERCGLRIMDVKET